MWAHIPIANYLNYKQWQFIFLKAHNHKEQLDYNNQFIFLIQTHRSGITPNPLILKVHLIYYIRTWVSSSNLIQSHITSPPSLKSSMVLETVNPSHLHSGRQFWASFLGNRGSSCPAGVMSRRVAKGSSRPSGWWGDSCRRGLGKDRTETTWKIRLSEKYNIVLEYLKLLGGYWPL